MRELLAHNTHYRRLYELQFRAEPAVRRPDTYAEFNSISRRSCYG